MRKTKKFWGNMKTVTTFALASVLAVTPQAVFANDESDKGAVVMSAGRSSIFATEATSALPRQQLSEIWQAVVDSEPSIESADFTENVSPYIGLSFGDLIYLQDDTVFYETADLGGSGATGYIGNEYTVNSSTLRICGFATLDNDGRVLQSAYISRDELGFGPFLERQPAPSFIFQSSGSDCWVAFYNDDISTEGDLGWVSYSAVQLETISGHVDIVD